MPFGDVSGVSWLQKAERLYILPVYKYPGAELFLANLGLARAKLFCASGLVIIDYAGFSVNRVLHDCFLLLAVVSMPVSGSGVTSRILVRRGSGGVIGSGHGVDFTVLIPGGSCGGIDCVASFVILARGPWLRVPLLPSCREQ
jgi:hypothetical protein